MTLKPDIIVGYSLGSLLLMERFADLPKISKKQFYAPIFDFKKEANKGGKVARTQLKFLLRWLNGELSEKEFYRKILI